MERVFSDSNMVTAVIAMMPYLFCSVTASSWVICDIPTARRTQPTADDDAFKARTSGASIVDNIRRGMSQEK
jgi:hypothetical protein